MNSSLPTKDTNKLSIFISFIGLIFLPVNAAAAYSCKNRDVEVTCLNAKCEINESFTPVEVTIDKSLEICAYSGCTKYRYKKSSIGAFEIFSTIDTKASKKSSSADSAVFIFDKSDNIGVLKFGALVLPMVCN